MRPAVRRRARPKGLENIEGPDSRTAWEMAWVVEQRGEKRGRLRAMAETQRMQESEKAKAVKLQETR